LSASTRPAQDEGDEMPEPIADAAIALGGAMLFAWFVCAFAQFAALGAGLCRRAPLRSKPSCVRIAAPSRHVTFTLLIALLAAGVPGMLAVLFGKGVVVVAAVETGALIGLWLGAHSEIMRWKSAIATWGCALGFVTMCASTLLLLLHGEAMRVALYVCAIVGAMAFGAGVTAFRFTDSRHRLSPSRAERVLYLVALVLIVTLGAGIGLSSASREFDVSALAAGCVLAAALGVCWMGGAHYRWRITLPDTSKRSAPSSWSASPDAWLVAACGPSAYEPANFDDWVSVYAPPALTSPKIHHASRDSPGRRQRLPRRFAADH
jgi:hypothetical protein